MPVVTEPFDALLIVTEDPGQTLVLDGVTDPALPLMRFTVAEIVP